MKNNKFSYFILLAMMLLFGSCQTKKEKICRNLPEGIYEGWFLDEGTNNENLTLLHIANKDNNTIEIKTSSSEFSFVNRNKCTINGKIADKICTGKINIKKGSILINGTYSYFKKDETGGIENPKYDKINGTFQIKQIQTP
ncbi:MAG TPA: hypothetical protein PLP27_02995 [Crocinitomicaceae bacterium]|nr:hypothetical protein [Crocinitomicaceae bacterium]